MPEEPARLIVGLGNPGREYAGSRHNVGFDVLERVARHEGLLFRPAQDLQGYSGRGDFEWARSYEPHALLVRPLTWMNRSGLVLPPLIGWWGREHGPSAEPCVAVYDDLDLPLGAIRLRRRGSDGGHLGLRSILESLGTEAVPRVRIGIGRPRTDAARHVLERFQPDESPVVESALAASAEFLLDWLLCGDWNASVARFHSRKSTGRSDPTSESSASPPGDADPTHRTN